MDRQLRLFEVVGDNTLVSPTDAVGDTKMQAIQRFLNKREIEPSICIEQYSPNGRKAKYYRLKYRVKEKVKTIHIPGGNIHSDLANHRAGALRSMINRGAELAEILAALHDYQL